MLRRIIISFIISFSVLLIPACKDNTLGNLYTITYYSFNEDGGMVPDPQIKEHGIDLIISGNTGSLARAGMAVFYWNTTVDGSGTTYQFGDIYKGNADLSLYPVWGKGYAVTYDRNNATTGTQPSMQMKPEGIDINLAGNLGALERTAFDFCGWNTETEGTGAKYAEGSVYSQDADITLYAMWYDVNWTGVVTGAVDFSEYYQVECDNAGNTFAVGYQTGSGSFYHSGLPVSSASPEANAVIVKYNSDGKPVWGASTVSATGDSRFNDVALGDDGSVYAVGYITGTGAFDFGDGAPDIGTSSGSTAVIVKYSPDGTPLWHRKATGAADSEFYSVEFSDGAVYTAGFQTSDATFDYGDGKTAKGNAPFTAWNAVIVKYAEDGTTLWVKSTSALAGTAETAFFHLTADNDGSLCVSGVKAGSDSIAFGSETIPAFGTGINAVIVKYDSDGLEQWVYPRTTAPTGDVWFNSITTDASGNIYTAGYASSVDIFDFGSGVTVSTFSPEENALLVKFSPDGVPLWARSHELSSLYSMFSQVSCDGNSIYAVGRHGSDTFGWGGGIESIGTSLGTAGLGDEYNPLIIKYNPDGNALWAKTATGTGGGPIDDSEFFGITANNTTVTVVGSQYSNSEYYFGTEETGASSSTSSDGTGMWNSMIVSFVK